MRGTIRTILALAAGAAIVAALTARPVATQRPPTAVRYAAPVRGDRIDLPGLAGAVPIGDGVGPTFLHFYNPECPCAEDSLGRLAALIDSNRDGARFVAVVDGSPGSMALARRQLAALGLAVVADHGGRMAAACGVTSTPEAVIFDAQGRLHFRGAYGSDPPTPVAAAASGVLADGRVPMADPYACPAGGSVTASVPDDEP